MAAARASDPPTRAPLSRSRVLLAAIRLADESGLGALTMRRLAQSLGVEAMSLYNHVANKEDLLDGMVDAVAGEIAAPAIGGDWKAQMRARAVSAHEVLMRHPWAAQLMVSRINVGPCMLRYENATIGCLLAAGFDPATADHAWNTIDSHVYGFTLQKLSFPIEPSEYASAAQEHLPMIPADRYPHVHALAAEVIAGRHDGLHDLAFGLELILDGLDRLLPGEGGTR